jgi:hypothetical protein
MPDAPRQHAAVVKHGARDVPVARLRSSRNPVAAVATARRYAVVMAPEELPAIHPAGWLLLAAILLSIGHGLGLGLGVPAAWPGVAFWAAGLLLASRVAGLQRTQTLLMLLVGVAGLIFAAVAGAGVQLDKALASNQALLAMLTAVSFLRLISLPEVAGDERDPRGRSALWRTLLGVHLFGSVINLSAVMILGDRQSRAQAMTPLQAVVLSRGFALAAHWSPFFAAMGVALSNAPGAQLVVLSAVGLPLALLGLAVSGWRLSRWTDAAVYRGYPLHFEALWVPALLAALVMLAHGLWPAVPILTFISGLALGLTLLVLLVRHGAAAPARLVGHVREGLPRMSGELALFLAAGVLAAGIASAVDGSGWSLQLAHFGATQASLLLVLMVGLSAAGVHPVISIASAHGILAPLAPDPNLMGITYLMTWAAGVSASPLSGMHLAMQGRFGIDARGFLRWNGGFVLFMLLADILVLHLFERLSG